MSERFARVPEALWNLISHLLPREPPKPLGGRPRVPDRVVLAEGDATPIGQDVPLGARFRSICRAGTGLISTLRSLHGSGVHRAPLPIDDRVSIVVLKYGLHDPLKDAARGPLAETAVTRRARTELRGERLPLASRAQPVQDTGQDHSVWDTRATARRLGRLSGDQMGDEVPKSLGDLCESLAHAASLARARSPAREVLGSALSENTVMVRCRRGGS